MPQIAETIAKRGQSRHISERGSPDDVYAVARKQFTEAELINLTLAIAVINAWNRFSITFHVPPALKSLKRTDA